MSHRYIIAGVSCIATLMVILFAKADIPCFEYIKDVPCPGCRATGSCDAQYPIGLGLKNEPEMIKACPNGKMTDISSGKYECQKSNAETGFLCVPKLDKFKAVVQEVCCRGYQCKFDAVKKECVQGAMIIGANVGSNVYAETTTGCLPVKTTKSE